MITQNATPLYHPGGTNPKTSSVPSIYIGSDRTEAAATCKLAQCRLLPERLGGPSGNHRRCYAHSGTEAMALASMERAAARREVTTAEHYSEARLQHRKVSARIIRLGRIGDPIGLSVVRSAGIVAQARAAALTLAGYTHAWRMATGRDARGRYVSTKLRRRMRYWRGRIMASCEATWVM